MAEEKKDLEVRKAQLMYDIAKFVMLEEDEGVIDTIEAYILGKKAKNAEKVNHPTSNGQERAG